MIIDKGREEGLVAQTSVCVVLNLIFRLANTKSKAHSLHSLRKNSMLVIPRHAACRGIPLSLGIYTDRHSSLRAE